MSPYTYMLVINFLVFMLGMGTFGLGISVLVRGVYDDEMKAIAKQTGQLVQKGFAEDVAGLVGVTNNLMGTMNELTQDKRGVGVVLTVLGIILMAIALAVAFLVYRMSV